MVAANVFMTSVIATSCIGEAVAETVAAIVAATIQWQCQVRRTIMVAFSVTENDHYN